MAEIMLASGSAIRQALLTNAGIAARTTTHSVDERLAAAEVRSGDAADIAQHLAEQKALSASADHANAFIIGADQTLELEGEVLSKPADLREAREQLRALSNRAHRLHSAFAVARSGAVEARQTQSASLIMRELSDSEIDWYLDQIGATALASVGAYQIEGLGIRLFAEIEGDYFTILGLPMLPLLGALRRLGAIAP